MFVVGLKSGLFWTQEADRNKRLCHFASRTSLSEAVMVALKSSAGGAARSRIMNQPDSVQTNPQLFEIPKD